MGPQGLHGSASIRLEDGRHIYVPQNMLIAQEDGSFSLLLGEAELGTFLSDPQLIAEPPAIPVVAEELEVGKRTIETGRVRIHKSVREEEEVVDPPLLRRSVSVERIAVNRLCEGSAPTVRQERDVLIVPVLEEVLVIEKRLLLKEEIHVRQEQSTFHAPQTVTVRREEVQIEHAAPSNAPAGWEASSDE